VAARLKASLRKEDTLGLLAADEFAAVIAGQRNAENAEHTARDL